MPTRFTLLIASTLLAAPPDAANITQAELVRRTQQLFDAVATGNRTPWNEYYADDAMYFDEKGRGMDKRALVANVTPLPKGYSGTIKIVKPQSRIAGQTAILSYDLDEIEIIYGQTVTARYHTTDTWVFRSGRWQIVAGQTFRYYEDPAPGKLDAGQLDDYVGTYELAPNVTMRVSSVGGKLYAKRTERPGEPLLPEAPGLFFRPGVEGRRLFRRDASGKVDALIDRRNNQDVVWKKL